MNDHRDKEIAELKEKMMKLSGQNKELQQSLLEKENLAMKQALGICYSAAMTIFEVLERLCGIEPQDTTADEGKNGNTN